MRTRISLLLCFAALFTACNEDVMTVADQKANLRIINVTNGTAAIRARQDNSGINEIIPFGGSNRYLHPLAGRSLVLDLFHPDSAKRFTFLQYVFAQDADYTIFLTGEYPQPLPLPLVDTLTAIEGKSRIRIAQLSLNSPDLAYFLVSGADTLPLRYYGDADVLAYGEWSLYTAFDPKKYSLLAKDEDGNLVAEAREFTFDNRATYSGFTYDSLNTVRLMIIQDNIQ